MQMPPDLRIPVATYRVQLNYQFKFSEAAKIVSYLHELGITEVYTSPCVKSRRRSMYGYDIVDPNKLNPELGGEEAYEKFVAERKKYGMGQIFDIVPNHMCVDSEENVWWMDVLENGPSSLYADFFDISWSPVKKELKNKLLIPILGEQYGRVLERQELKLNFEKGAFFLAYFDHRLPIVPETYAIILKQRIDKLRADLHRQHPDLIELLSIITALTCLPAYTEREEERVAQRHREKEIIKKRLRTLCTQSSVILNFINDTVSTFNGLKGDSQSFNLLDELLGRQVWRLSHWRVATEEINYRRFFDINGLAAIRMEDLKVFRQTHHLVFRLIRDGSITGLRVDHPDGLYNPSGYFKELQRECFLQKTGGSHKGQEEYRDIAASDPQFMPFYIVGEKILMRGERLPEDWPIFSTIGYAFLNPLNGIFVDTTKGKSFDNIYARFTGLRVNYQDLAYEKKRLTMLTAMSSEINALSQYLSSISEKNRHTRDFTLHSIRTVIMEVIACFPVYRTYCTHVGMNESDRHYVELAISKARRRNPALSASIFDFLQGVLLLKYPENMRQEDVTEWIDFVMRFQQVTGPVMAKGVEDTAFYVYNRLVSLNEVGGNPEKFGTSLDAFHGQNTETATQRPYSLITTSTHDTKRSEDVRARLNVLSEIPDDWRRHLATWSRLNKKAKQLVEGRAVPERNEEYLFYQTLLGTWPTQPWTREDHRTFRARMRDYMLKAVREAKVNSSWVSPDEPYEEALMRFIDLVLGGSSSNVFREDLAAFGEKISYLGMFNSLSQTLLKIMSPGIPDFYQGTEIWDFSLVDPDNRRPVNFSMRKRMLKRLKNEMVAEKAVRPHLTGRLLDNWQDGAIKLYVTFMALNYRKKNHLLFKTAGYTPLVLRGAFKECVCAFARRWEGKVLLAVVPRFVSRLVKETGSPPLGKDVWRDTSIVIPNEIQQESFHDIFTNEIVSLVEHEKQRELSLGDIFTSFPVAMLEGK